MTVKSNLQIICKQIVNNWGRKVVFDFLLYEWKKVLYNMVSVKMGGMAVNCMKCGRDLEPGQVFCAECRAEMEKYPVKPGTVVQLPRRREESPVKKMARRRTPPTPEEQVKALRKAVRGLIGLILVLLTLIAVLLYPKVKDLLAEETFLPGQNYSSITDAEDSSSGIEDDAP